MTGETKDFIQVKEAIIEKIFSPTGILMMSFGSDITIENLKDFIFSTSSGSQIGTATNQKIAFWGLTPVVQPGHIADAGFKGSDTLTDADASLGATTQAELEGILQDFGDKINLILADLAEIGLQASS